MTKDEFKSYIESLGFKNTKYNKYENLELNKYFRKYEVEIFKDYYNFINFKLKMGFMYSFNDLTPLKKISRSIKLKKILN